MANTKKLKRDKKATLSISIKWGLLDDFKKACRKDGAIPSVKAAEFIEDFLKNKGN